MKDKIIEKQDEIIANLKEVGQLYFRIKDKATKQDVARMTSLTTKGMTLESELIILKAQDISVETTINQEVEKRIAERMPSEEEIEQWMQENRWASARQYVKWLRSRLLLTQDQKKDKQQVDN